MFKIKCESISNIWKQLTSILSNLNNFHSLEDVDCVSETQLQVGENSDWIIWRLKGWTAKYVTVGSLVLNNVPFLIKRNWSIYFVYSAIFKPTLRQYWTNIASMLDKRRKACQVVHMYQQTRDIKPMLVYSWRNVYAAGQTVIQHWFNVSCSLGTCGCPANTRRWPNVGLISAVPRIYQKWSNLIWSQVIAISPKIIVYQNNYKREGLYLYPMV